MFPKQYRYDLLDKKNRYLLAFTFLIFALGIGQNSPKPSWSQVPSPMYSNLKDLFLFSEFSGVAAGDQILILEQSNWRKMKIQPPEDVSSMFALDTNTIYTSSKTKFQDSELYFWNGSFWKEIYHPLNSIGTMFFSDKENGVIAGLGEIAVLKNNHWKMISPPTIINITSVILDQKGDIWAVSQSNILYRYNGSWQKIKSSLPVRRLKLFHSSIYVLGNDFIGKVKSDSVYTITTNKALNQMHSLDVLDDESFITAGNNGLILQFKNKEWNRIDSPVKTKLNSIKMLQTNNGWCVGQDGSILHYSNQKNQNFNPDNWKGFDKKTFYAYAKVVDDEYGVVVADFNEDDFPDIFTCGLFESNHLYINQQNGFFIDMASKKGLIKNKKKQELNLGACAGDLDNDGDIDLYITSLNGTNRVYQNMRQRGFIDYSNICGGIGEMGDRTNASIFGDVDNDGDLDIFITNEYSSNRLYLNNGVGIFEEVTELVGLTTNDGGMGCSFGDIDGDGDLDLYVSNWSKKNLLYKNLLIEKGNVFFENITKKVGVGGNGYDKSNGVVLNDIDNDGDLDIFVSNRKTSNKLYFNNGKGIFKEKTAFSIGLDSLKSYGVVIADFNGDLQKDIYISNVGRNTFYLNDTNHFEKQTSHYGNKINGYSTGSAVGDFDKDGDLDIYVANYIGEGSALLKNKLNNKKFIKIQIIGIENNRSAIGAKLSVFKDGEVENMEELLHYSEINGGSGYASMNELTKTIPLQNNAYVDIKVIFPKGEIKKLTHVKTGQKITIYDVDGFKKRILLTKLFLRKRILDPHKLFELIKWFFVLLLIGFSLFYKKKLNNKTLLRNILLTLGLILIYYLQYYSFEYKNIVLSTLLPLASIILALTLIYLYNEREKIKHLSIVEQEQIRLKLSRDLHDDLASTVSTIGIYLTLIKYKIDKSELKLHQLIEKSEALVSETTSSITDLIWAINPKQESIENIMLRFDKNFKELFQEKNITFSMENTLPKSYILQPKIKQNVYLILKEALNNILKYANARKVILKTENHKKSIYISVEDDGIGFDLEKVKDKGHGLTNMQKRAEEIGADFKIRSKSEKGTLLQLVLQKKKL